MQFTNPLHANLALIHAREAQEARGSTAARPRRKIAFIRGAGFVAMPVSYQPHQLMPEDVHHDPDLCTARTELSALCVEGARHWRKLIEAGGRERAEEHRLRADAREAAECWIDASLAVDDGVRDHAEARKELEQALALAKRWGLAGEEEAHALEMLGDGSIACAITPREEGARGPAIAWFTDRQILVPGIWADESAAAYAEEVCKRLAAVFPSSRISATVRATTSDLDRALVLTPDGREEHPEAAFIAARVVEIAGAVGETSTWHVQYP